MNEPTSDSRRKTARFILFCCAFALGFMAAIVYVGVAAEERD